MGLNDAKLEILDKFEDKRYIRKSVNIFLPVSFISSTITTCCHKDMIQSAR
jgi:hypothetical protein